MNQPKKPKTHRQKEKPRRYLDSMRAAVSATGYSWGDLRRCKQAGCPAFRASRVYVEELEEWIKKNGIPREEDPLEQLEKRKLEAQSEKLEFEIARQKGEYILRAEVETTVARAISEMKRELFSMANSLAPQFPGLSIPEMQKRMEENIVEALNQVAEAKWQT